MTVVAVVVVCVAALAGIGVWNASTRTADPGDEPAVARVSVFTFVETGIVFVDPGTSEIVWKNVDGDQKTIGEDPWRNPTAARPSELTGYPAWREDRDIVGHPDLDLVSWVETADGARGDLVVVKASTGEVLAQTAIPAPTFRSVVIAGVDDEAVHFATPDPNTGFPDMPAPDIWTWRWQAGEEPEALPYPDRYYSDVSAGTGARYGHAVVEFLDADGNVMATTPDTGEWLTDFGRALSPDGRYWYEGTDVQILDTTTGEAVALPSSRKLAYGWTGSAELTMTGPFVVCSAATGQCRGPAGVFPDVCAPYDLVCGNHLPVN